MLNKEELISILFYLANGRIKGSTRIHKVVFLIEKTLEIDVLKFVPWKFGPWSPELEDLLESLEKRELLKIHIEPLDLNNELLGEAPVKIYEASKELIDAGRDAYKRLMNTDPAKAFYLKRLVLPALNVPLTYLLAYIYSKYPEMITKSSIRVKVEKWRDIYGLRIGR